MQRIPYGEKIVVISPKRAITYSIDSIPLQTTHMTFIMYNSHFHHDPLTQPLPTTISHLTLQNFVESIDKLPSTLTHFTTDDEFNQPVDKLPPTLTHLTTGEYFNHPVITILILSH
jgi:hypothetical protein